ncbi:putative signal peptide protein [Puccinia sorghi]|uniref:Putative signal peptide protein n=1 Tax=Puccinia sorghi TaxID=27349 RepID=A0A0L6UX01_9BASI|nr:putative signal peptide protein [Puccinia sorghi]
MQSLGKYWPVWALAQVPLGAAPPGLGFVPRRLVEVPRGLEWMGQEASKSWHTAQCCWLIPKRLADQHTSHRHTPPNKTGNGHPSLHLSSTQAH